LARDEDLLQLLFWKHDGPEVAACCASSTVYGFMILTSLRSRLVMAPAAAPICEVRPATRTKKGFGLVLLG
jgi:hypothetical protein